MSVRHKAYKFRLYPNKEQQVLLGKTFGCVRFVYNYYLSRKTALYRGTGKSMSYTKCAAVLVALKRENDFLGEVDSIALQQALHHLDTAFRNFFRDKSTGYPKFKSKKCHRDSYSTVCVNNNIRLERGRLMLPKVGPVCLRQHRSIPEDYTLKSATVSRTPADKYFVSLLYDYETETAPVEPVAFIGLDYSMAELFVSSEDDVKPDVRFLQNYRKSLVKLAKEQQALSHRHKGSNRYNKQRLKVARLHEHIANQRADYLHKLSRQIANAYDVVCVEDLDMKAMSQAMHFGKYYSYGYYTIIAR